MRTRRAVALVLTGLAGAGCAALPRPELRWPGSAKSSELVVVEGSSVELPVPRDPRASSGELRRVPLRWDPVLTGDVAGYRVERAEGDGVDTAEALAVAVANGVSGAQPVRSR